MKRSRVSDKRTPKTEPKSKNPRNKQGNARTAVDPRRLLIPIDFSAGSLRALDFADSLARRFNAAITLVHVIDPLHAPGRFDATRLRSLRAEALEDAKAKMVELAALHSAPPKPMKYHVIDGIIHDAIVKFASESKTDWIVMGSKGQTGVKRLLAGSVAENVVRHARCPVLVVP